MISIIIPTLNEESVIKKTLIHLKTMENTDYEIIISDGNSIDKTIDIANQYADRVIVYTGTTRQTIAGGRNIGAEVAKGEYFIFCDADISIPNPDDFFTEVIAVFKNNPKIVAATARLKVFPEMETVADRFIFGVFNWFVMILNNIFGVGVASGEFQFIRKSAFQKVGGFNEAYVAAEDMDMFSKLSKIGKTRFLQNMIVYHTGRRAHKIGWTRLLFIWSVNGIFIFLFHHGFSKQWDPIR